MVNGDLMGIHMDFMVINKMIEWWLPNRQPVFVGL